MKDNFHKTVIEARHDDILSQLDKAHQEEVLRNKSYLLSIADTVLMSARQNIALRGGKYCEKNFCLTKVQTRFSCYKKTRAQATGICF